MGFGSFTLLFGYLGYLVLAIPIGIIGLAIFIYDLATYGKQYDQMKKEEIQRYGVPLIGKAVACTEFAIAHNMEPMEEWDKVYHVTGVSEDGLSLTTQEGKNIVYPSHWSTKRVVKK